LPGLPCTGVPISASRQKQNTSVVSLLLRILRR
jgi:hypothetical protein